MKLSGRFIFAVFCLLSLSFASSPALAAGAEPAPPAFDLSVQRFYKAADRVGIMLVSLTSGQTLLEYHSKEALVPASLVKLLTSYAALKKLGPSFRFGTDVFARSESVGGVINGDIWIKGYGDPFFVADKAKLLAQILRDRGIRQITGGVYIDNGFFAPAVEHICLDASCTGAYNPVVSATAVDFNMVPIQLSVPQKPGKPVMADALWAGSYARVTGKAVSAKKGGSVKVRSMGAVGNGQEGFQISGQAACRGARSRGYRFHAADPAGLFAHTVRAALEKSGIKVLGQAAREGAVPSGAIRIARYESPPLVELVSSLNKHSNNFMAEMLLKGMAGQISGAPGTTVGGVRLVRAALRDAGIPEETGMIDCGSGLSRFCLVSPDTFCRLLVSAWRDPAMGPDFVSTLAANAEEGTLRKRMRKPGLTVRGKTGTLNDVIGFAGYFSGPSGKSYAVAIILNDVRDRGKARLAIDAFMEEIAFSM